uniref:SJCHGC09748 protein n=1 Tax=Schistosoma japonicum TaxID=6182 RepID=Q5BQZ5_SCHJA|nr:SJCHGC09748 protein [Schistosoma japonicum]
MCCGDENSVSSSGSTSFGDADTYYVHHHDGSHILYEVFISCISIRNVSPTVYLFCSHIKIDMLIKRAFLHLLIRNIIASNCVVYMFAVSICIKLYVF